MANSKLGLFNQAVSKAGGKANITDPEARGREADLCRLWYDVVRDNVQQTGPWPSTKATAQLAVLKERDFSQDWAVGDPSPGWRFAYAAPSDLLRPRFLASYARFDRESIGANVAIMANEEKAIMQYTRRVEDVAKWDTELYLTTVLSLASFVSFPLNGVRTLSNDLREQALTQIVLASTDVANEQHVRQEAMPELLTIRSFSAPPVRETFSYPYAVLNAVPA